VNQGIEADVLAYVLLMMFQFLAEAYRLPNHKSSRGRDGCVASVLRNRSQRRNEDAFTRPESHLDDRGRSIRREAGYRQLPGDVFDIVDAHENDQGVDFAECLPVDSIVMFRRLMARYDGDRRGRVAVGDCDSSTQRRG